MSMENGFSTWDDSQADELMHYVDPNEKVVGPPLVDDVSDTIPYRGYYGLGREVRSDILSDHVESEESFN